MRVFKTTVILVIALNVGMTGCSLFHPGLTKSSQPMTVALQIQDISGNAQAGAILHFTESGWVAGWKPYPYWEPKLVYANSQEITSNTNGAATVKFYHESLNLNWISLKGSEVTNFTIIFNRYDGMVFTNRIRNYSSAKYPGGAWQFENGYYEHAKNPRLETYTITLQ